jgi:glutamate formiminotransferase/formiminotetrahydrofolate cyclodeaminase
MDAFSLPKKTEEEKAARQEAIAAATKYAIEVPLKVMQTAYNSLEVVQKMAEIGNPNSVSDAGVGALAIRSAVMGAHLNVKINCAGFKDTAYVEKMLSQATEIETKTRAKEAKILNIVNEKIA